MGLPGIGRDHVIEAKEISRRGPKRDQHIHIGTAMTKCCKRALIEPRADIKLHRCRQHQFDPSWQMIRHTKVHPDHLQNQRRGQQCRDSQQNQGFICFILSTGISVFVI